MIARVWLGRVPVLLPDGSGNEDVTGRDLPGYTYAAREATMFVSQESADQTSRRLQRVLGHAEMRVYKDPYLFHESPVEEFPDPTVERPLALVRDEHVWSGLVPAPHKDEAEAFQVFRFHFPPGVDNSGFIGWLASHLKVRTGTGVFVICGHNTERGGIFDYWGCPWDLREMVLGEIDRLRAETS